MILTNHEAISADPADERRPQCVRFDRLGDMVVHARSQIIRAVIGHRAGRHNVFEVFRCPDPLPLAQDPD